MNTGHDGSMGSALQLAARGHQPSGIDDHMAATRSVEDHPRDDHRSIDFIIQASRLPTAPARSRIVTEVVAWKAMW